MEIDESNIVNDNKEQALEQKNNIKSTAQATTLRLMPRDVAPQGTFDKLPFD